MDPDDESAALAHQQDLEARRFYEEAKKLLTEDAEAYCLWLDRVAHEMETKDA